MPKKAHFTPAFFQFFAELAANNERGWFTDNKARYEAEVKAPLLAFITDFGPKLGKISEHFVADPRGNGGSMFRIHRDTRFSKDKTPYKTHGAAQFRHAMGKDVHAPGFYLHLEPGSVFAGAGIWHPDSQTLKKIRSRIVEHPDEWKKLLRRKAFKDRFTLEGDSLKRAPKGFDPEHPLIEDLRRKDFIVTERYSDKQACQPGFIDEFAKTCKASFGLMTFLAEALEIPY